MNVLRPALFPIATVAVVAVLALAPCAASALAIAPVASTTGIAVNLANALLGANSGVNLISGSAVYQGTNNLSLQQSGTYAGFNLAPTFGSSPTLSLPDGIFLTTGSASIPMTNTVNNFFSSTGSGSNAQLGALSAPLTGSGVTFDANAVSFSFTVGTGVTSVSAEFVFGTEEFPTQTVTDIFGFFVDGVNYAKFSNGSLISNTPNNPTNFISNPVGAGLYGIEYNGLTRALTVTGILSGSSIHTLTVGIADTSDTIFDSGVFIGALKAGTAAGSGGITPAVPEPETYACLLAGLIAVSTQVHRRSRG